MENTADRIEDSNNEWERDDDKRTRKLMKKLKMTLGLQSLKEGKISCCEH